MWQKTKQKKKSVLFGTFFKNVPKKLKSQKFGNILLFKTLLSKIGWYLSSLGVDYDTAGNLTVTFPCIIIETMESHHVHKIQKRALILNIWNCFLITEIVFAK